VSKFRDSSSVSINIDMYWVFTILRTGWSTHHTVFCSDPNEPQELQAHRRRHWY